MAASDHPPRTDADETSQGFATADGGDDASPHDVKGASTASSAAEETQPSPTRIGRYRIRRVIGAGGMGTVYEAMQDQPRRVVALKLMQRGLTSRSALRRFEYEAQILARLRHPNIAQVYEAGTHHEPGAPGGGVPYFAMEYIPSARPLTQYAKLYQLPLRERLLLFIKVCEAVHHGHQKGIIHRDLKPGNILVDSGGEPKVIDFGVARATDSDMVATTLQTDAGQLIGTLQYMSPEQCDADPRDLDTRSDVYALGVVLYELLCERPPYDVMQKSIYEVARVIQEEPPTRMSSVNRLLRGDVETIVLKAMEKDRQRRYQSAADLADDIERYLNDEPIEARPPSLFYQITKFAKRNRVLVAASVAVMVTIVAGVIGIAIALGRALEAEADARASYIKEREARRIAEVVNSFLNDDLLAAADPEYAGHRNMTMREALDAAALRIEDRFAEEPLVEAAIRATIARTYLSIGEPEVGEPHIRRALQLNREHRGERDLQTFDAANTLALVLLDTARYDDAERLLDETIEAQREALGEDHESTLTTLNNRAVLHRLRGEYEESEATYLAVLEKRTAGLGRDHPDTISAINNLASLYQEIGRPAEAEDLLREALALSRGVLHETHPRTLTTMNNLGNVLESQGKLEEAQPILESVLKIQRRTLHSDHPNTLATMNNVAVLYYQQGRYQDAEPLFLEILDTTQRIRGERHPETLQAMNNLAALYNETERYADAEPLLLRTIEIQEEDVGRDHPETLNTLNNLAFLYDMIDRAEDAERLYKEVLDSRRRVLGAENLDTLISAYNLARLYDDQERFEEALPLLAETVANARAELPADHWLIGAFLSGYGDCLRKLDRFPEAEEALLEAERLLRANFGPAHQRTRGVWERLATLYDAWNKPDRANEWRAKLAFDD